MGTAQDPESYGSRDRLSRLKTRSLSPNSPHTSVASSACVVDDIEPAADEDSPNTESNDDECPYRASTCAILDCRLRRPNRPRCRDKNRHGDHNENKNQSPSSSTSSSTMWRLPDLSPRLVRHKTRSFTAQEGDFHTAQEGDLRHKRETCTAQEGDLYGTRGRLFFCATELSCRHDWQC